MTKEVRGEIVLEEDLVEKVDGSVVAFGFDIAL